MLLKQVFVWNKDFETTYESIDTEHKYLVDLLNSLGDKISDKSTKIQDLKHIFDELIDYTGYHFNNEEQLSKMIGVDTRHRNEHVAAHKRFVKRVLELRNNVESSVDFRVEGKETLDFLVSWLTFHILGMDKLLTLQMRMIEQGKSPADAYEIVINSGDNRQINALVNSFNSVFGSLVKYNEELLAMKRALESEVSKRTIELEIANKKLQFIAMSDHLTGLSNRRMAISTIQECITTLQTKGKIFSVIMLDLDRFKSINDKYGHDAGDRVLCEFSKVLKFESRTDDVVCRLGGDEFLIICPDTNTNGVINLALKLLKAINKICIKFDDGGEWSGSSSIGIATANSETKTTEHIIKSADIAVYKAKELGRNCVCNAYGKIS
ncbi:GGDEF domain-containing protein [Campylobacter sp. faydin G-24]|uniref:diguanylate cyclase n=1 Tax=Campylobacter anatolicus TaxID=2829105 RepID=A0ABS5HJT0_9BACT|nr:GGDEF domain-containing protein [Campylobacter anatolicus]MBR8461321.1 GGDEF domain-containing protein [Campylobacter anatolicus]MBR8464496.1 GGDEF domain-containing protein [Campylobacter anatolicus]MBR8466291.1 GGDEF domain-containing protein [Campylobacter anatolicus]